MWLGYKPACRKCWPRCVNIVSQGAACSPSRVVHGVGNDALCIALCKLAVGTKPWCGGNNCSACQDFDPQPDQGNVWVGLKLRTKKGKNNGKVKGKKYFSCAPGYGLVVRTKQARSFEVVVLVSKRQGAIY